MKYLAIILTLILSVSIIIAQNNCPTLERAAFAEAQVFCNGIADSELCYGNPSVSIITQEETDSFASSGDKIALTEAETITTARGENLYGVALISTHSYPIDSWQQYPVSLAIIGDAQLTDNSNETTIGAYTAVIGSPQGANVRSGTSTDYRIIQPLFQGDAVKIIGITPDSAWLRVQMPDGENGWITRNAIAETLPELPPADLNTPDVDLLFAEMTDISIITNTADARCADAPESGILLQTPNDEPLRFRINNSDVLVQGSVFLQATEETLTLFVLSGTAQAGEREAIEGYKLIFGADGAMPPPEVYDFARLAPLPTELLPRYEYVGIELATIVTPRPSGDVSPLRDLLVDDPCTITVGDGGANLRGGPGLEFPIRGVLGFRESARPTGRATGSDGNVWWELAQNVWISAQTTVTGGDCISVSQVQRIPAPPPTSTPEN